MNPESIRRIARSRQRTFRRFGRFPALLAAVLVGCDSNESAAPIDPLATMVKTEAMEKPTVRTVDVKAGRRNRSVDGGADGAVLLPAKTELFNPEGTPEDRAVLKPIEDAQHLKAQIARALSAGEVETAYQIARRATRLAPDDPGLKFLMARVLGQRQRYPEAVRLLDRVVLLDPSARLPALGQSAQWLVRQGEWSEAESRYRTVLEEVPQAAMVHQELASLLLRQGRSYEAAVHLRTMCREGNIEESMLMPLLRLALPIAGSVDTERADPIGRLGVARAQASRQNWQAALATLDGPPINRIAAPRQVEALRGRLLAFTGDMQRLAGWIDNDADDAATNADTWFAWATYLAWRGNHDSATRCFCEVVLRDPTDAAAYEGLSQSLEALDQREVARRAAERSRRIRRTQEIGSLFAEGPQRDREQLDELIGLLGELRRPDESLLWQAIRSAHAAAGKPASWLKERLSEINRQRLAHRDRGDFDADSSFVLCGLDVETLRSQPNALPSETRRGSQAAK
ncbi:tetratricopeptide repeat protein [Roseiconus nitratireducens]|nr:tetratricopeptide repeat protein [Roseiconus nitratireducens]